MRKEIAQNFYNGIKSSDKEKLKSPENRESISTAVAFAYDDAKRTMTGIGKYQNQKNDAINELKAAISDYFKEAPPKDCNEFNEKHNKLCLIWVNGLAVDSNLSTYGKAQKIVNMTFKYLYCCEALNGYENYFDFCHMPLDSFTLEWFKREIVKNQNGIKIGTWSSMCYSETFDTDNDGFRTYNYYAEKIQKYCKEKSEKPLLLDFIVWPEMQLHLAAEAFYFKYNNITDNKVKNDFKVEPLCKKLEIIKNALDNQ